MIASSQYLVYNHPNISIYSSMWIQTRQESYLEMRDVEIATFCRTAVEKGAWRRGI